MDVLKFLLMLLCENPKGMQIMLSGFALFAVCDAEGHDREKVCKAMIAALPEGCPVFPAQVYALSEAWDILPDITKRCVAERLAELQK